MEDPNNYGSNVAIRKLKKIKTRDEKGESSTTK
jgi:hypothetical protein